MSTTSPCCWCDPLPCRQALDRSQSQSKLRCSPCIGKKTATDPGILPSFSSSEKPQKRRKRSHTNVSNTLVARLQHLRHKRRNARFKGLRRVHTPPHLLTAHTAAYTAKQGAFRMGALSLPSDRFARFRNPAWPGVRTALPLLGLGRVCSRRAQRACGTATRSCASLFRGVAAPLGCVIPLFFSLTTLMSFTVLLNRFVGTQKIERLFFSYSGAFLEQKA